jgi:prolipoprotein diacylglyceryltransferase
MAENVYREGRVNKTENIIRLFLLDPLAGLNKNPIFLKGRSFHLVYFGIFAAMNTFLTSSMFLFYIDAKGYNFKSSLFLIMGLCMAGDIVGVKLFHAVSLGIDFFNDVKKHINQTAMYNQGGILGIFSALIIIALFEDIDLFVILDGAAYGAVIGLAIGRLGCYNYGCCFGRPTKSICSVTYTNPNSKVLRLNPQLKDVPLIPTQVYSSYANILLFVLFTLTARNFPFDGVISLLFVVLYNGFRIFIEKYRVWTSGPNYAKVAVRLLLGFLLFFVSYFLITGKVFAHRPFLYPISLHNYWRYIFSSRDVFLAVSFASVISFLFYGIHGKVLGKHIAF